MGKLGAERAGRAEDADVAPLNRMPAVSLLQALNQVRDVVLIVTKDRRILYSNPAAERLLARRDLLQARQARLEAVSAALSHELGRSIDTACGKLSREVLVLRRSAAPPLVLVVKCLDAAGNRVMVLGSDPAVDTAGVARALRDNFGLTRSEAEVAAAVAAGDSLADIAERRKVSLNTIRTQVKTIAAKLGCTRQSQIAAIVRALPTCGD